jgi:NDP-sugar pyrophosphorylase family protein
MIDQTTVLILCGGLATRLQPITKTIPKSLVMINNKPMLQYQLDMLQKQGIRHVVLCVGYLGEMIKDTFGDKYGDILLEYSFDGSKQLGTGGAIKKTYSKLSNTFFVLYGDSYLPVEYKPILEYFNTTNKSGLMTLFKNDNLYDTSNVIFKDNQIVCYDKNNKTSDMNYIDYGLSIFNVSVFNTYPADCSFDLSQVMINLVNDKQIAGYEVFNRFYEMGSINGLNELELYLKNQS